MATTVDGVIRRWVDVFWTASAKLRQLEPEFIGQVYFRVLIFYSVCGIVALWANEPTQTDQDCHLGLQFRIRLQLLAHTGCKHAVAAEGVAPQLVHSDRTDLGGYLLSPAGLYCRVSNTYRFEVDLGSHPAHLSEQELLDQCEVRRQRRSGPGGQHRNKVETGIFMRHQPTGVTSEATERRHQNDNLQQAIFRLRPEPGTSRTQNPRQRSLAKFGIGVFRPVAWL